MRRCHSNKAACIGCQAESLVSKHRGGYSFPWVHAAPEDYTSQMGCPTAEKTHQAQADFAECALQSGWGRRPTAEAETKLLGSARPTCWRTLHPWKCPSADLQAGSAAQCRALCEAHGAPHAEPSNKGTPHRASLERKPFLIPPTPESTAPPVGSLSYPCALPRQG